MAGLIHPAEMRLEALIHSHGQDRGEQKKRELLARLRQVCSYDQEYAHHEADMALLDYIDDPEIARAFDAVPRWYA